MACGATWQECHYGVKWCTNDNQPNLETLLLIARLLGVEVQDLIAKDAEI